MDSHLIIIPLMNINKAQQEICSMAIALLMSRGYYFNTIRGKKLSRIINYIDILCTISQNTMK